MMYLLFQTRHHIEKVIDWENSHLYHKVRSLWTKKNRGEFSKTLESEF